MYVFLCQDTIDGIFTGVYDAFASKYGHRNLRLSIHSGADYELFCEYLTVAPDSEKSRKVARTLYSRFGAEVYDALCQAIMAKTADKRNQLDKADCIYRTILYGFSLPDEHRVLEALGNPCVARIFELSRATHYESHHLLGFLRFSELENGVLFARIHPKNDVLPVLAEHFTDRLPMEHFLIYDAIRQTAVIHKASSRFLIIDASDLNQDILTHFSEEELIYRKLWCSFFDSIAIDARNNPKLQSQNIPKRFWEDTVELHS